MRFVACEALLNVYIGHKTRNILLLVNVLNTKRNAKTPLKILFVSFFVRFLVFFDSSGSYVLECTISRGGQTESRLDIVRVYEERPWVRKDTYTRATQNTRTTVQQTAAFVGRMRRVAETNARCSIFRPIITPTIWWWRPDHMKGTKRSAGYVITKRSWSIDIDGLRLRSSGWAKCVGCAARESLQWPTVWDQVKKIRWRNRLLSSVRRKNGETTKRKLTRNVGNEGNAVSEHFERVWDEGGSVIAVGFASRVPSRLPSFLSANWRRHQTRFLISFCSFVFLVVPFPCLVLGDSAEESDLACSTRTCAGSWRFQQHSRVVARVGSRWRTRRCVDTIWTYCGA